MLTWWADADMCDRLGPELTVSTTATIADTCQAAIFGFVTTLNSFCSLPTCSNSHRKSYLLNVCSQLAIAAVKAVAKIIAIVALVAAEVEVLVSLLL